MDRRRFLVTSVAGVLAAPLAGEAQQAGKVYRIGELREGSAASSKSFVDAMRELGWVEGQNFKIENRNAERRDQLPALAAELVRLKVDLILTGGTSATRAVREATKTIPVVFNLATDPVDSGLVSSLARPGGNLTGFALGIYDEKLLEILKEALPSVSRVVYPGAGTPGLSPRQANLNVAGRILGVDTHGIAVQGPEDFDRFFAAAKRAGAGAVLMVNVAWFRPHLKRIGVAAAKSRLPALGYAREFSESGGLLSYGPKPGQNVVRVAAQIDKILKGANPAELPVEQPTKFELVINLKTATALGLTIPPSLLLRADQVIE
jgi:putative ABC transport system substrate-binding protein